MATRGQLFPSKYLKPDPDFLKKSGVGFREATLTIRTVIEREDVAPQEKDDKRRFRPVLYFAGIEKGIPINATIFDQIATISGSDNTSGWEGVRVRAYITDERNPQGGTSKVVRFREVDEGGDAAATAASLHGPSEAEAPIGAPQPVAAGTFDPDEIPF